MVSQHSNSCCCPVIVGCHKRRGQDHFDAQNDGHATYEPTLCRAGIPPRIDEARIRDHLGEMVRGTVEEALNAMLDAEVDRLCGADRYQRSEARKDTRDAGHYERSLQTKAGEVKLKMPKLRQQTFETAIIERYRRRESSVEEALIEMYLAGVSVRRVEDITEALWGTKVVPLDGVQPQQEDLCEDRGLAERTDRRRPSRYLSRRYRDEA